VRHRGKIEAVVHNARCIQQLIADAAGPRPAGGHFDAYLWSFVGGVPQLNEWVDAKAIPCESEVAHAMSSALKGRGFKFVGPKTCYSLMQSCGLVIDHPKGTVEWEAARRRLQGREAEGGPCVPAATTRAKPPSAAAAKKRRQK
jgi:DNA-3-methyladenine glycosylase I